MSAPVGPAAAARRGAADLPVRNRRPVHRPAGRALRHRRLPAVSAVAASGCTSSASAGRGSNSSSPYQDAGCGGMSEASGPSGRWSSPGSRGSGTAIPSVSADAVAATDAAPSASPRASAPSPSRVTNRSAAFGRATYFSRMEATGKGPEKPTRPWRYSTSSRCAPAPGSSRSTKTLPLPRSMRAQSARIPIPAPVSCR